jgi:DNA polymerase-3 subunit delta'
MTIPGIVLHPTAQHQLDDFITNPSHAVLLGGPAGIGKSHIARGLAAALLGASEAALENHAYFRTITPEKSSISIDEIRKLITFFRLKVPGSARVQRIAVITDAEAMGREAQNALLKLLEEPPQGSLLVLTSSFPERLLPTIRSRTQLIGIAPPDPAALREHFAQNGYDLATIQRTLLRTGTNVAEAVRILELGADTDDALQLVKQVLGGTPYDRMLLVDGLAKQKEQVLAFVTTLAATATASLQAAATKQAPTLPRWQAVLEAAHTAGDALERSGNAKIVLTELMLAL